MQDDAVPTIHKPLLKKRRSSLDHSSRNAKKTIVESALKDHQEDIDSKIKEVSTDTSNLLPKRDIGLSSVPKVKLCEDPVERSRYHRKFVHSFHATRQDQIQLVNSTKNKR